MTRVSQLWDLIETWGFREDIRDTKDIKVINNNNDDGNKDDNNKDNKDDNNNNDSNNAKGISALGLD